MASDDSAPAMLAGIIRNPSGFDPTLFPESARARRKVVLDRLVALRDRVGPFGTLLQIGLDWSGPNEAWEREGMRLLAQEVMPKFRQHAMAQAAE